MELEYGWHNLGDDFIFVIVQILATPQNLINVCRPATAILKKLVEADPRSAPGPIMASSSTRPPAAPPGLYQSRPFLPIFSKLIFFRECISLWI